VELEPLQNPDDVSDEPGRAIAELFHLVEQLLQLVQHFSQVDVHLQHTVTLHAPNTQRYPIPLTGSRPTTSVSMRESFRSEPRLVAKMFETAGVGMNCCWLLYGLLPPSQSS
jgi:hypothetical protein